MTPITPAYAATLPTLVLLKLRGQLDDTQSAIVRKELEKRG